MEHGLFPEDAAITKKLQQIDNRVHLVKSDHEVGVKYMRQWEEVALAKKEGRDEGETIKLIKLTRIKLQKGLTVEKIADELEEQISIIQPIVDLLEKNADSSITDIYAQFNDLNAD